MIDATAPESFKVAVDNQGDTTNPSPRLVFSTDDKASGLDHYTVYIGEDKHEVKIDEVSSGYYKLNILAPGEYKADVVAYDKA